MGNGYSINLSQVNGEYKGDCHCHGRVKSNLQCSFGILYFIKSETMAFFALGAACIFLRLIANEMNRFSTRLFCLIWINLRCSRQCVDNHFQQYAQSHAYNMCVRGSVGHPYHASKSISGIGVPARPINIIYRSRYHWTSNWFYRVLTFLMSMYPSACICTLEWN